MGIILSALAAAGDEGVRSLDTNIKHWDMQDLEDQRAALATQKELTIAQAANELKNKPLNDFAARAALHSGDMVDLPTPAAATVLTGTPNANAYGSSVPDDRGLTGNIASMKAFAASLDDKNPDKQPLLAQIADQESKQNAATLAAAPTSGPITKDAIIAAAMKDSLAAGDGPAYAAGLGLQNTDAKTANMQNRLDYLTQAAADKNATHQERTAMMAEVAKIRADAVVQSAQLRIDAAEERAKNGAATNSTLNSQLNTETQNIRASTALISTLTRQLPDLMGDKNKDARQAVQDEIDGYKQDIEQSKGVKNLVLKQLGLPTVDDLPKPAKVAAPAAPLKPFNPADFKK